MHRRVAVWLVAVGVLASAAADAADECGAGNGSAPQVRVTLAALAEPERVQRSICDWFASEPWRVTFVTADSGARGPALSVVVRLRAPREAELVFDDGSGAPERRELALPRGLDETGLEIIAQVIHSSAEAYGERTTARAPATVVDEPFAAAGAAAPHTRAADSSLSLNLSAGFHAYARGPEPTTFGPGALAELGWQLRDITLGVYARAALWTSATQQSSELELSLRGATAQGGASLSHALGSFVARAALGAGADFARVDVRVRDADEVRRLPFSSRARPFVAGELGLQRRVWRLDVGASALVRWQLLASHYQVQDEEGLRTILRPWRLQPGALIEIGHVF